MIKKNFVCSSIREGNLYLSLGPLPADIIYCWVGTTAIQYDDIYSPDQYLRISQLTSEEASCKFRKAFILWNEHKLITATSSRKPYIHGSAH